MSCPEQVNYDALAAQVLAPKRTPVQQAIRTPVQQAIRTPVQHAIRTPVQQASRNSYRNSLETHTQTHGVSVENEISISKNQEDWIKKQTGCNDEQLEKAIHILSISRPRPRNMMMVLLKSAFHNGECILEPTCEEEQESKEERWAKEERSRVQAWTNKFAERMQDSIVAALSWFQGLPEEKRRRVESNILNSRPTLREQLEGKKPFGPLVLVLLREERRKLGAI